MSSQYGVIESVKRVVVTALSSTITSSYPDSSLTRVTDNVQMEYPMKREEYPGIWVRFSLKEILHAGLEPVHTNSKDREYQLGRFSGTVTLSILALSSLERDRIADAVVNLYLFGEMNPKASEFFSSMAESDYLNISVGRGRIRPSGQGETAGTPWDPRVFVYEDTYSFDIMGQFASQFSTGELVKLSEVRVLPEMTVTPQVQPGEWV